jgi:hypothetical protein
MGLFMVTKVSEKIILLAPIDKKYQKKRLLYRRRLIVLIFAP